LNFVAIDFETANNRPHSACAVGIVVVKNGEIFEEYYSLIKPPDNFYMYHNTRVHGINPEDTENAPTFEEIYPEIRRLMREQHVVAHNEAFDRNVMYHSMEYYDIAYADLLIPARWDCTVKLFRKKLQGKVNLAACCSRYDIPLNHHNALSDAKACAKLFMIHLSPLFA
jgi:DNA polymerase III subunit epsilon